MIKAREKGTRRRTAPPEPLLQDEKGHTPLHRAVWGGHVAVTEALLRAAGGGPAPQMRNRDLVARLVSRLCPGCTPTHSTVFVALVFTRCSKARSRPVFAAGPRWNPDGV